MFQLSVEGPNIEKAWVVLVKSSPQDPSVVCGLWSAEGELPATVSIGETLYAYASSFSAQLQNCVTIPVGIRSLPLSEGNIYGFTGSIFVQEELTPPDIEYGLRNGRCSPLTCGLCQDITVNGVAAQPPVCVQSLLPQSKTLFRSENQFWLGVGQFPSLSDPQPGLVLSTSLIEENVKSKNTFGLTLGLFNPVAFSKSAPSWAASYQPSSSSFQILPA
jgi:hypothetical protein